MNQYVTGAEIRRLRENKQLTQEELAAVLHVSSKAVSKWETGKGFPDISLLEPLAKALDLSVIELLAGAKVGRRKSAQPQPLCRYEKRKVLYLPDLRQCDPLQRRSACQLLRHHACACGTGRAGRGARYTH